MLALKPKEGCTTPGMMRFMVVATPNGRRGRFFPAELPSVSPVHVAKQATWTGETEAKKDFRMVWTLHSQSSLLLLLVIHWSQGVFTSCCQGLQSMACWSRREGGSPLSCASSQHVVARTCLQDDCDADDPPALGAATRHPDDSSNVWWSVWQWHWWSDYHKDGDTGSRSLFDH